MAEKWSLHFEDAKLSVVGDRFLFLTALTPWLTVPFIFRTLHRGRSRYVFGRDQWVLSCALIWITCALSILAVFLALPDLVLAAAASGFGSAFAWLLILAITTFGSTVVEIIRSVWLTRSQKKKHLPLLTDFPVLRPQNTKVINLDVGALAPRLGYVSDILHSWNRDVEKWAHFKPYLDRRFRAR